MTVLNTKSATHTAVLTAILMSCILAGTNSAHAESEPLPPVPARFVDHGPGNFQPINFRQYCRVKFNKDADQHIGPTGWWNAVSCQVAGPGNGTKVGIDLYDVCKTLYPRSKPVNNTGSAYNWYCKK